jgi:hypothetical protein
MLRPGATVPPPPEKTEVDRPISLSVKEDRVEESGRYSDVAKISVKAKTAELSNDKILCSLIVSHETLGDTSHRVVDRGQCELLDEHGNVLAIGEANTIELELSPGEVARFVARARTGELTMSQFRVAVEAR